MSAAIVEKKRAQKQAEIETLEQQVAILDSQLAKLVLKDSHSPVVLRMLGKAFGFGASGKLEWVRFKLKYKQEELGQLKTRREQRAETTLPAALAPDCQPSLNTAGETTAQKMERMIAENPAALAPHIRRVYQKLIEEEKLARR